MIREWIKNQTDYRKTGSIAWKMRSRRMGKFNEHFRKLFIGDDNSAEHTIKILDVGGVPDFWKYLGFEYLSSTSIVCLNLSVADVPKEIAGTVTSIAGTATDMKEFEDGSFDLVFSNSVIEHVGDYEKQKMMADEMLRLASHGYIQTPNKNFFMEPHFLFPFFQFLPVRVREEMVYRSRVGHFSKAKTREEAKKIVGSVQLLSEKKLKQLFPDKQVSKEKWFGLTKSFIVKW